VDRDFNERGPRPRKFQNSGRRTQEAVHSIKVNGGRKRTYFMDIKSTRDNSYYIVLNETYKNEDGTTERHRIFIYKEDLNRVVAAINELSDKMKELLPDFNFDITEKSFDDFGSKYSKYDTDSKYDDAKGADDDVEW
jgi:tRNA(Phe) wybutosine-synthesizing methylase Tyw3